MLDKLKQHYLRSLHGKIEEIRVNLKALRHGDESAENNLRILAHSLHGSGSTYGFPDISKAAKEVEHAAQEVLLKRLTVLITVLQDTAEEARTQEQAPDTPPEQEDRILIIEDDEDISRLLTHVLGEEFSDYSFDVVETELEVNEALHKSTYALIILDLVLPDCDGRELLRQIRASQHKGTPVFILSGMANEKIQADCRALGATHFFNKPFDPQRIAVEMEAVFSGRESEASLATLHEKAGATPARKKTGRILVAEDDELLARIIKHRLGREGLNITHVENGEEALAALEKGDFSLVILDVKMPIIDGFEVLERFRENRENQDVPVIMLTAMGSERDIVRAYELGASDYILKPFSPVELIARVKSLVRTD